MTINVFDRRIPYVGNGVTTIFDGPKAYDDSDVLAFLVQDGTLTVTFLTLGADYTVAGLGLSQTTVTLVVAPPVGFTLVLLRTLQFLQSTQFTNQGAFYAEMHEDAFDRVVMMAQQLSDRLDLSLHVSESYAGPMSLLLPSPDPLAPLVWNATGTGIENGSTAMTGDMLLRANLAEGIATKGTDLVKFYDPLSPAYLQTTSDIINGLPVSLHRFLPPAELAAIRAHTSTYDCNAGINLALAESGLRSLYLPNGRHCYQGNLFRSGGLSIRGESNRHSILRCTGAGGIVFTGGAVTGFDMQNLDLENIRLLAAIADAGTAVTMNYTGGSGSPPLGPRWMNVAIEAEAANTGYNKGVRGTNIRDFRVVDITLASSTRTPGWPANFIMTHGMELDGDSDPVELWISNLYAYYLNQVIHVSGQYEGLYVDHLHTVAAQNGIYWDSATPNPVCMISDSYVTAERDAINLNRVSYFRIQDNCINPTAPVPDANFRGVVIRRTVGDQTQASSISNNTFIGVGYSSSSAFTETAVYLENANTVEVVGNTIYDMDVGVKGIAGAGNRIHNRYITVTTPEDMPASMRTSDLFPEFVFKAARTVGTQVINVNVLTTVLFDTEERDDKNCYTPGTGLLMPPAGHYNVRGRVRLTDGVVGDFLGIYITIGGAAVQSNGIQIAVAGTNVIEVNGLIDVTGVQNVAIRVNVETGAGGPTRTILNSVTWTRFEAVTVSD